VCKRITADRGKAFGNGDGSKSGASAEVLLSMEERFSGSVMEDREEQLMDSSALGIWTEESRVQPEKVSEFIDVRLSESSTEAD